MESCFSSDWGNVISSDTRFDIEFGFGGDFDPQVITERLGISPDKAWTKGDPGKVLGYPKQSSFWKIHSGEHPAASFEVEDQIKIMLSGLMDKRDAIKEIIEEGNRSFLTIVVHIDEGDFSGVHLDREVIDFCSYTKVEIEIPMYIYRE